MRRLSLLLGFAVGLGCGRIGIDPVAVTDARPADAAPEPFACAVEGAPCDDANVCTPSSTCVGGVCGATTPPTCTVAHSEDDYATTQGAGGWFYGFWEVSADPDATFQSVTDFQELVIFPGELWRPANWAAQPSPNFSWAYLARWGGHPATRAEVRVTIRRWISDVSGRATAVVHMSRADSGGDGTRLILMVDGVQMFSRDLAGTDSVGFTESVPIDVSVGTAVDLLLHPVVDEGQDTSTISMIIESR